MSTITNEAVIKVTTDASGVEEGGRRIDASTARTGKNLESLAATAQKTGKSLDNLGGSNGLRTIGDGASTASGKVDRATITMAASIQRATAAADAGAKSGADFYASLANARGLNMTALRPYLDQLDAVTRKTAQAAAAQRQLDAGNNFLAGLRTQADGIGKTASQLAALRAEQLGVADDARPLIEQLQAAEQAAGNAGSAVSGFGAALAAAGASAGIASVVQLSDAYNNYVAKLRLATTGQSEFVKAQASVQQIAASAQSDLSSTASLYASITKSTRDLGIAQSQVADITETVSLGLKVSGASAEASGSAIYQLSQAFNMGALRSEEFNAVTDASPRLMEAMADGIGVPVGALRAMAEQGLLTTEVMANALPRGLKKLQEEAKSVETVGGSVTVLKDKVMLLVGATAQSSGVVAALSGGIKLLSDNLVLAGGAMATVAAVKLGTALGSATTAAYASVVANNARLASNLAAARADVAATASAATLASARVVELRAAVLAAEGNVALSITTNALIPAQARATAASAAHAAALSAQTAATGAASLAARAFGGVMALTGGPVGAVIALLGIAATAWAVWGNKAEQANKQAAQSTEESTAEMIVRLDEQITKLRERNALAATEPRIKDLGGVSEVDKDGLARAKAALDANKAAQTAAGANSRARMMLRLDEVELSGKYEAALGRVKSLQSEVATATLRTRTSRLDDWYAQNGSSAQRLAAELEKLKKEFGAIPPEMEKLVRAKFADPASTKSIKDQASAAKEYADLVDRINGKSAGVDSDYQENLLKLAAGYNAGKQSLEAYRATVEAYITQQPFAKQPEEERLRALKEISDFQDSYSKGLEATSSVYAKRILDAETEATRNVDLAETYGLTKSAVEQLELARLDEQLAQRSTLGLTLDEIETLEKLIDTKKRNAGSIAKMEGIDAAKKAGEELDKFLDPTKAQTFGDALKGAFGAAGDSMTQLVSALDAYGIRQAEVDKAREDASVKYAAGTKGLADATAAINAKEVKSRLSGYGDMAAAAKGFFAEGSKGYGVLSGAEKAYRAAELALALQAMTKKIFFKQGEVVANTALNATKLTGEAAASAASTGLAATEASAWGVTAVVKAIASLPFPLNLAAGAATLAAVVAIGAKMVGGIGGGSIALSEQRQKAQGTGSVLGSDEKSASIANSLDLIESATSKELNISTGMLASLRNIEAGIDQFASLLVRTTGVTGKFGADMGKNVFDSKAIGIGGAALGGIAGAAGGAYVGMGTSYIGAMLGGPVGMALGAVLGAVIGKTFIGKGLSKIFGGKQTVEDTGFTMGSASFGNIINGGVSASQYADIKKDGGWFRSDKKSTQLEGIGAEGNRQISTILTSLYDTVFEAGSLLGIGGDAFANQLNSFVVDIGKVSLKGKTGDQIQEELSAIFSKVGDDLASFSVAGITQFQKVGEGALETLARVAVNYASLDAVLASVGKTFGATGVASLGAREDLLTLAGGIDELASQTASFAENFLSESERLAPVQKYVTDQLASMGLSALRSRDSFKQYVLGLDLTNVVQREQYVALMDLQEAYAKLYPEIEDATKTLADARSELTDAYNAENDAISSTIDRMGSFAASLKSLRENALLGSLSPLSPQEKYAEAKAQYETVLAAARSGDESAQSNYSAAFNSFLTASRAVFASSGQYQADFAYAQASTAEAERWAGAQVDVGKAQLDALKLSVNGLITLDKSVLSVRDAILQMHQVMGTTAPPAPGAMAAPQINMPTPVMYASYGADNTVALVAELKSVRQELASLRAEQAVQTGHLIQANAKAASDSADQISGATTTAVKAVANSEQRVPFE